jgi:mono/diheme cytochrome c family protein
LSFVFRPEIPWLMSRRPTFLALMFLLATPLVAAPAAGPPLLTYDALPLGTVDTPLVLRTFVPDPGIDEAVFAHHGRGKNARKYDIDAGKDTATEVPVINGIPAAIAVNHGPALSYAFDTTEGRLLYAWQGGFLDLFPYWGDQALGNRVAYDYLPRLVGTLFYQAAGRHPLELDGRSVAELGRPRFVGYDLVEGQPTFIVAHGRYTVRTRVQPLTAQLGLRLEISVAPPATLTYRREDARYTLQQKAAGAGALEVTLTGPTLASFAGYPRKTNLTSATRVAGEQLSRTYGCVGCHSTDGSGGHGPTWAGLYNRERPLIDGTTTKADEAYLLESIGAPNAKIVHGFAPNFMPAYKLKELEAESLVRYIKSLAAPK